MDDIEHLLTDSYIEFANKIEEIHIELKALTAEFKKKYDEYNAKKESFHQQAKDEFSKFEAGKATSTAKEDK